MKQWDYADLPCRELRLLWLKRIAQEWLACNWWIKSRVFAYIIYNMWWGGSSYAGFILCDLLWGFSLLFCYACYMICTFKQMLNPKVFSFILLLSNCSSTMFIVVSLYCHTYTIHKSLPQFHSPTAQTPPRNNHIDLVHRSPLHSSALICSAAISTTAVWSLPRLIAPD